MRISDERGGLVAALVVSEEDEVISFKASGQVIRSAVADVSPTGRDTMGVKFVHVQGDDSVSVIALYPENGADGEESTPVEASDTVPGSDTVGADAVRPEDGDPQDPSTDEGRGGL